MVASSGDTDSTSKILLYDLDSKLNPKQWSPNVAKARLLFNYLGIPYEVKFISYPDIETTLKGKPGVIPWKTPEQNPVPYTVPAIKYDGDKYLMDSDKILDFVIERFNIPRSKAIPNETFFKVYKEKIHGPLIGPIILTNMAFADLFLDEGSLEFYRRTKKQFKGLDVVEGRNNKENIKKGWEALLNNLNSLDIFKKAINETEGLSESLLCTGDYLYGDKLSFADMYLFGVINWTLLGVQHGSLDGIVIEGVSKDKVLNDWFSAWYDRVKKYSY